MQTPVSSGACAAVRRPVKICGITRREDAELCVREGAAALGAVFFPRSPRNVPPAQAAALFAGLPAGVARVGVFVDAPPEAIAQMVRTAGLTAAQLHGRETPEAVARLRALLPALCVIKVLRSTEPEALRAAAAAYPHGTRFLLECGACVQLPGGCGAAWDWAGVREAAAPLGPFAVAGGLAPGRLAAAAASGAALFDISSGVEAAPGVKDPAKVAAFLAEAASLPPTRFFDVEA